MRDLVCAACGAAFVCGAQGETPCWCAALPPLPAAARAPEQDCLCPACLAQRLSDQAASDSRTRKPATS